MLESGLNGSFLPTMSMPPVPSQVLLVISLSSSPTATSNWSPFSGSHENSASKPDARAPSMFLMTWALYGATKKNVNALSMSV